MSTTVPAREGTGEHEDRGSRFLAWVFRADDEAAFQARLEGIHALHPKARHHCWAWRIGGGYRFNDDGEPGGTAGRPMLQVLEGAGLDQVGAVCVRYFGGVKLGTGGLARAYGAAAARAAEDAGCEELVSWRRAALRLPFALLGLRDELASLFPAARMEGDFDEEGWGGSVELPEEEWPRLVALLEERSGGRDLLGPSPDA